MYKRQAQIDFQADVAALRVHLGQGWQGFVDHFETKDVAQTRQIADEGCRIEAITQQIGVESQGDVPGALGVAACAARQAATLRAGP